MIDNDINDSYYERMKCSTRLYGIRGAVCSENTKEDIAKKVSDLYKKVLTENNISEDKIVSIQFSVTPDLTALNPATALRQAGYAQNIALFCSAEPLMDNGMPFVIRLLLTAYLDQAPVPVYMHGAENLRSDLLNR